MFYAIISLAISKVYFFAVMFSRRCAKAVSDDPAGAVAPALESAPAAVPTTRFTRQAPRHRLRRIPNDN